MLKRSSWLISLLLALASLSAQPRDYTVTVYDSTDKGYYFLALGDNQCTMLILDHTGDIVFFKQFEGNEKGLNFELQPNGLITFSASNKFYLMDSTFRVIDSVACANNLMTDYHDLRILPNGHFLLLGKEILQTDRYKFNLNNRSQPNKTVKVESSVIQEQDAQHQVVFEWRAKDHYAFDDVDPYFITNRNLIDWTHFNSVDMDHDGNILVSARNFSEVTKIDRNTGSIIWRLGGKRNQFRFVNCPVPFYGQHDVRRIDNSHLTMLDNGDYTIPHGARALEFELDETNKIATLKRAYTPDSMVSSRNKGNVQRIDDGRTLVNTGVPTGGKENFSVVDSTGRIEFKLVFNGSAIPYKVIYHATLPWQLRRPQLTCFDSLGVKYLTTTARYASRRWNDSTTSSVIAVTKPGFYQVFVPYGDGGFISSEKLEIKNIADVCQGRAITRKKKRMANAKP